ncbi:hypothetical protein E4U54_003172 [Claviceps lovelessii]|nr:hypothetical protein E4U54_003172 [Claviceps lovelessii]
MARQRQAGAAAPKRRSRKGCWPCKARKVKCGEEHPACKNCVKTGDICDYSVRLNWEGRRTKRLLPDKNGFESPIVPSKRLQWLHHDFSTKNGQIIEVAIENNRGPEVGSPFDRQSEQSRFPTCVSLTNSDNNLPDFCYHCGKHHTGDILTFIDESMQLYSGSTDRGSYVGRMHSDDSKDIHLSRPPHKGFHLNATEPSAHRKDNESFAEFPKLDVLERIFAAPSAEQSAAVSSTTLFPCPSTNGELPTRATSWRGNYTAHHTILEPLRSSNSAESWVVENGEPRESAKQSGCLWEALDMNRFGGPLSNLHIYPYEIGTSYAFDEGEMDGNLQQSAGDNANLVSHQTYIFKQSTISFGEQAVPLTQA